MFFGLIPDNRPSVSTAMGRNTVLKDASAQQIEASIDRLLALSQARTEASGRV